MARAKKQPQRKTIFVNRDGPLEIFDQAANNIPADAAILRVFYGMGGQGKSALFRHIRDTRVKDHEHVKSTHVDLSDRRVEDGILLLTRVRNGLARGGVSTGAFDFALAIVWESVRKEDPYPDLVKPLVARAGDLVGDVAADGLQTTRELVEKEVETWPGLGTLVRLLSNYGFKKGQDKWLAWSREHMNELLDVDDNLRPGDELVGLLPWLLAMDMNYHLESHGDHRFVLLLDEYESLLDNLVTSREAAQGNFDEMLKELISNARGLLVVFFLRRELPWKESPNWKDDLEGNQYELDGLDDHYAGLWLDDDGVTDGALRAAMIESGRETPEPDSLVCPLFLELQVEHWRDLVGQGVEISPDIFRIDTVAGRREKLVQRLFRDGSYGQNMLDTMQRLAVAEQFDEDAFKHVIDNCGTQLPYKAWDRVCSMSLTSKGEDGYVTLHRAVRDALRAGLSDKEREESVSALLEHYTKRASVASHLDVTDETIAALTQAAYLRRQQGAEGYVGWLMKLDAPVKQAARNAASLANWQTALGFCRAEFGEQHEDTAASHNNVASNLNAQGRYKEAEPLFRKGLEISEKVLGEAHPDKASSYNSVGYNLYDQGRYEEAEPLFRKGLEIREKELGAEHPDTAASYNNVAYNLLRLGKLVEAEACHQMAVEVMEKRGSGDHPDTKMYRANLAYCRKVIAEQGGQG